jgi:predicted branched-subunit amino acid permease
MVFLGRGLAQWSAWQASTAVGIALGAQIPSGWALDFAIALTFIALVIPTLTDPADGGGTLGGNRCGSRGTLAAQTGSVLAAVVGIIVGLLVEGKPKAEARRP